MAETPRPADAPVVIDTSGAPQGPRHFVFLNPEQSPATAAIDLLKAALARNLRTIVYCRSRRMTELVSLWAGSQSGPVQGTHFRIPRGLSARGAPEHRGPHGFGRAAGRGQHQRSGAGHRHRRPGRLHSGGLSRHGHGNPPARRPGGRAQQESAVIVVAGEDALDQYFARNPEDFFSRPAGKGRGQSGQRGHSGPASGMRRRRTAPERG